MPKDTRAEMQAVHNGGNKRNGRTHHVVVERKSLPKSRRMLTSAQTHTPIYYGCANQGNDPTNPRIYFSFARGMSDTHKDHLRKTVVETCSEDVMRVRWRSGKGNTKDRLELAMTVRTMIGRRVATSSNPICDVKMDVHALIDQTLRTMPV